MPYHDIDLSSNHYSEPSYTQNDIAYYINDDAKYVFIFIISSTAGCHSIFLVFTTISRDLRLNDKRNSLSFSQATNGIIRFCSFYWYTSSDDLGGFATLQILMSNKNVKNR